MDKKYQEKTLEHQDQDDTRHYEEDEKEPEAQPSLKKLKVKVGGKETVEPSSDQIQQVECQICAFPYDKNLKVPRILQCGHTFCQTCIEELRRQRGPDMMCIQCPNCRTVTQVTSINNLPENEYVFEHEPQMFTMNVFSPYEAAKRLGTESKSLTQTGERYMQFLCRLRELDTDYESEIVKNFEVEF